MTPLASVTAAQQHRAVVPSHLVNERLTPVATGCLSNIRSKLSGAWKATSEMCKRQSLIITLIFFSIWGCFGLGAACSSATLLMLARLVHNVWRNQDLNSVIQDQSAQIVDLQNRLLRSQQEAGQEYRRAEQLRASFSQMATQNKEIYTQSQELAVSNSHLQLQLTSEQVQNRDMHLATHGAIKERDLAQAEAQRLSQQLNRVRAERDKAEGAH